MVVRLAKENGWGNGKLKGELLKLGYEISDETIRRILRRLGERKVPIRFLIHDNDSKFSQAFDSVFVSEQVKVIHTPCRAPNANAYAER